MKVAAHSKQGEAKPDGLRDEFNAMMTDQDKAMPERVPSSLVILLLHKYFLRPHTFSTATASFQANLQET